MVAVLWIAGFLNYFDRLLITSMRDALMSDIPMSNAQFGLLTSSFLWVYGIFSPLGGFIADKFGRRLIILASVTIWSVVTWYTGHAHSYPQLLWARACMGMSEACYVSRCLGFDQQSSSRGDSLARHGHS